MGLPNHVNVKNRIALAVWALMQSDFFDAFTYLRYTVTNDLKGVDQMTPELAPNLQDFHDFIAKIASVEQRSQLTTVLNWITTNFPQLVPRFAWNQPMFTDHETFIIGFSVVKDHLNIALEQPTLSHFQAEIKAAGYRTTKQLWQIDTEQLVETDLLERTIQFNIDTKQAVTTFWRPKLS